MASNQDTGTAPVVEQSRISEMLTVEQAAKEVGVSISQIYRAVKGDISKDLPKLPCIKIGRRALIRKTTLVLLPPRFVP